MRPVNDMTQDTMRFLQQEMDLTIIRKDAERFMELIELMSNLDREFTQNLLKARFQDATALNVLMDYARSGRRIA